MNKTTISLGLLILTGCVSNDSLGTYSSSEVNVDNLTQVTEGMDEAQVRQMMRNPHSEETIQLNNDQYDIWFYVTNPTMLGQNRMVHYNLTPITFKNDIVASVGWDYYRSLCKSRDNLRNLGRLRLGMTQAQVRQVMRTPDKEEQIPSSEEQYDILFYITSPTGGGSPCDSASNLTPLLFKNNKLISTDCAHYEQQKLVPFAPPSTLPGQVDEKSIENALKPVDATQPASPAAPDDKRLENTLAPSSSSNSQPSSLAPEDKSIESTSVPSSPSNLTPNDSLLTTPNDPSLPAPGAVDQAPDKIPAPQPDATVPLPVSPEKQTTQRSTSSSTPKNSDDAKRKAANQDSDDESTDQSSSKETKGGIDLTPEDDEILQRDNDLNFDQF